MPVTPQTGQLGDNTFGNDAQSGTGGTAQFLVEYEPTAVAEPVSALMWGAMMASFVLGTGRRAVFRLTKD
jgi:hypothetical protein